MPPVFPHGPCECTSGMCPCSQRPGPAFASVPMIGADEARIRSLEKVAQATANQTGKKIKLSKFSVREDVKDILPVTKD